jgi:hypothetical protein
VRKPGLVCHFRIAEEAIDGVEKGVQSPRIFASDPIAIMAVLLARTGQRGARSERAEIVQDGEAEGGNCDQDKNADQRNQRGIERGPHINPEILAKRSKNYTENCGEHRGEHNITRRLGQFRPSLQQYRHG